MSSGVPDLLEIRGRGLVDLMAGELTGRLGHAELVWSRVSREPYATVALRPGTQQERRGTETDRPNVVRAGAWTDTGWPATMEGAVRSGLAAARRLTCDAGGARMTVVQELTALDRAAEAGTKRLLELQHPDGWWVGELESNATMIAEHLFWLHFMGLRDPRTDRKLANELLARRRADGTWSNWFEGPANLSTTIESYVALKMAGVDPGAETRAYIRSQGGIPAARVFTKCFLALLGQWPWQRIPPVPPEIVLLPPSAPFSIYNLACWARQTVVPLSVVMALRPERPAGVDLREIGARPGESKPPARPGALRRRRASARRRRWVRARQEADGGWGGIQPPWVWSIVMLAVPRPRVRGPAAPGRGRGLERVPDRRGRPAAPGGLPVAGLGHRARRPRRCAPAASRPTTRSS